MTSVTEPSSTGEPTKITTITYDSAERVGTVTRADSTTEEFSPAQVQGWTNSGTSGSPAPSVLLAEVGSTYTDPLRQRRPRYSPDWRGMGLTDQDDRRPGQRHHQRSRRQRPGHDHHRSR